MPTFPSHWKLTRLRFCISRIEQGWSPQCENRIAADDEWAVLKVGCVNADEFNANEHKALPADLEPDLLLEIRPGDILMSRANTRELLGSAVLVQETRPRLLLCDKLYRIRTNNGLSSDFLVAFLRSSFARFQLEREATGTSNSMQNIGQDTIRNLVLPLPPAKEQADITAAAQSLRDRAANVISGIETAIVQLGEYRSALISTSVTGQIDVRNYKAQGVASCQ